MTPSNPHHSPDTFGQTPVQSFVVPAIEMGPEELARPRRGRPPVRKPADRPDAAPPTPTDEPAADRRG